eukprot:scaffold31157_cov34-Phaeocystis_antarctica.AAC.2
MACPSTESSSCSRSGSSAGCSAATLSASSDARASAGAAARMMKEPFAITLPPLALPAAPPAGASCCDAWWTKRTYSPSCAGAEKGAGCARSTRHSSSA